MMFEPFSHRLLHFRVRRLACLDHFVINQLLNYLCYYHPTVIGLRIFGHKSFG
jgi:hypothetical protein